MVPLHRAVDCQRLIESRRKKEGREYGKKRIQTRKEGSRRDARSAHWSEVLGSEAEGGEKCQKKEGAGPNKPKNEKTFLVITYRMVRLTSQAPDQRVLGNFQEIQTPFPSEQDYDPSGLLQGLSEKWKGKDLIKNAMEGG